MDQKATGSNLQEKIDSLVGLGVLPAAHTSLLHLLRDYGNKAAHELSPPQSSEVGSLFGIIDQLLKTTYQLPYEARRVQRKRNS